ncbi:MAG: GDSL-type esterase/lipase family protein [Lachnospiraceae bacterium]|nr:GDSL-type esterase/lipase family protein [Lachnospiraceae bacterium]
MFIYPDNEALQYSGRIDFDDKKAPVLVYAGSFVKVGFTGNTCKVKLANKRNWAIDSMGVIIDGVQGKIIIAEDSDEHEYDLVGDLMAIEVDAEDGTLTLDAPISVLDDGKHEITLFKRMDGGAHYVTFLGFEFDDDVVLTKPEPLPVRKMEVIGDSVSCGEVSEAVHCVAMSDPENNEGFFSNSWYSYSWQVARRLGAELHITSQGGISLFDKTGWFNGPDDLRGIETCYDKLEYNPPLGEKLYDCSSWKPNVIVVAIGQNDATPVDIMKDDYEGEAAAKWRAGYKNFLARLQKLYDGVTIVCATTLLMHDPNWDKAIGEVVDEINREIDTDASGRKPVHHFMYKRTGAATPGHPRIPEHDEMAAELASFLEGLGDSIWD